MLFELLEGHFLLQVINETEDTKSAPGKFKIVVTSSTSKNNLPKSVKFP